MNLMPGNLRSLSAAANSSESEAAHLVARARVMMVISALTTLLAIAAVVVVVGYRVYGAQGNSAITNGTVMLPKGARVISSTVTASTIGVTIDVNGAQEVRIYDRRTMQQVGRLRFGTEQP
ncbi:MAG: hypothetical protein ABSE50_25415 [Xanthobacteraceae bacterium]